ncbi:MAG: hypothetical protein JSS20_02115 [Proteobacteria bacterium]|nr:hypothetical protein [Pseudomonadota bacterium]
MLRQLGLSALALAMAVSLATCPAGAQSTGSGAGAADEAPRPPDGFYVTPTRPMLPQARPLIPDRDWSPGELDMRQLQQEPPQQGGGCRYQERKLELIV